MSFEQKQYMVRSKQIDFSYEEALDFLLEMNEDLKQKMSKRNIYLVIHHSSQRKRCKSCTDFFNEPETDKIALGLREMDSNLNDSFLDKCNYLISDRFMDEDDTEDIID